MDRYFTLVSSLVWPLATLLIALIFRQDLGKALGRVGQFKYRDLELTFRDDLRQAEQLARAIPPPAPRASAVLEVAPDEAKVLGGRLIVSPSPITEDTTVRAGSEVEPARRPPREAIEAAWTALSQALVKATSATGDRRASGLTNPDVAARFLVDRGRLGDPEALLVGLLRTLRDRSIRLDQPPPSVEDAQRFIDLAKRITTRIEELV